MRLTIKVKLAATFIVVVAMSAAGIFLAIQNLGALDTSFNVALDGNVKRIGQDQSAFRIGVVNFDRETVPSRDDIAWTK